MRRSISGGLVLSAIVVAGCTSPATVDGVGSPAAKPYFVIQPAGPGPDQAGFDGRLVVRHGCVLVTLGPSKRKYVLPAWPKGFTLAENDAGRFTVQDADGATVAVERGKDFNMSGSLKRHKHLTGSPDHQLQQLTDWLGRSVPEACIGGDVVGVWVVGRVPS